MLMLVDDYLQTLIAEKLLWLKKHPDVIDHIFRTGRRDTLAKLRDFIVNRKVKVIIGYPREQTSLPAYVITLAPEQEQPLGLGDDFGGFEGYDLGIGDDDHPALQEVEKEVSRFIAGTYMNSNYRIECWSDNGDLTSYMYIILKWCLWSSRRQMIDLGWVNITLSGTDLEPVPDYMPFFIYRRAAQLNLMYENLYYEDLEGLEKVLRIIEGLERDEDGNIIDPELESCELSWLLKARYLHATTGEEMAVIEYLLSRSDDSQTSNT